MVDAGKRSAAEADAASGRVDLLAGTYLTAERLERFDFVHPAYLDLPVHVWVARDKARQYASLADLASHSGLAVGSAAFPPALAEPLAMLKPARTRVLVQRRSVASAPTRRRPRAVWALSGRVSATSVPSQSP